MLGRRTARSLFQSTTVNLITNPTVLTLRWRERNLKPENPARDTATPNLEVGLILDDL